MNIARLSLLIVLLLSSCRTAPAPAVPASAWELPPGPYVWRELPTEPYRGKQDDIFFVNASVGWYVNGSGRIYKSIDGGESWTVVLHKPGTYFRAIAFIDEQRGFAGNIGTNYFPNVTDTTPLYETRDGGTTWTPVDVRMTDGPSGVCAIEIRREPFINAGVLDHRVHVYAAGRVGGPAFLLHSADAGETWGTVDLREHTAMILDIEFVDGSTGFISGASATSVEKSHARILRTSDGGATWQTVYESNRPWEITWKSSFPTPEVGYVTIQNYNRDPAVSQRFVAKTTDGGKTWSEVVLADDHAVREFGVGFITPQVGWVGATTTGFHTADGGATWQRVEMGKAVNNIRLLRTPNGFLGWAIGVGVHKLDKTEEPSQR